MVEESLASRMFPGARLRKPTVAIISQREDTNMPEIQRKIGPCEQRRKSSKCEPVKWTEILPVVSNTQRVEECRCDVGTRLDNV